MGGFLVLFFSPTLPAPPDPINLSFSGMGQVQFFEDRSDDRDGTWLHISLSLILIARGEYAPLAAPASISEVPPPLPASLKSSPKPHQVIGFNWLVSCWRSGMPGALLADDMGLDAVTCHTFDADSVENWEESDAEQRGDLEKRWQANFASGPTLRHVQISRRINRTFHAREITARFASGRTILWDLDNGIDGVMRKDRRCVVGCFPQ